MFDNLSMIKVLKKGKILLCRNYDFKIEDSRLNLKSGKILKIIEETRVEVITKCDDSRPHTNKMIFYILFFV